MSPQSIKTQRNKFYLLFGLGMASDISQQVVSNCTVNHCLFFSLFIVIIYYYYIFFQSFNYSYFNLQLLLLILLPIHWGVGERETEWVASWPYIMTSSQHSLILVASASMITFSFSISTQRPVGRAPHNIADRKIVACIQTWGNLW